MAGGVCDMAYILCMLQHQNWWVDKLEEASRVPTSCSTSAREKLHEYKVQKSLWQRHSTECQGVSSVKSLTVSTSITPEALHTSLRSTHFFKSSRSYRFLHIPVFGATGVGGIDLTEIVLGFEVSVSKSISKTDRTLSRPDYNMSWLM